MERIEISRRECEECMEFNVDWRDYEKKDEKGRNVCDGCGIIECVLVE